jgi:hypothetical protein
MYGSRRVAGSLSLDGIPLEGLLQPTPPVAAPAKTSLNRMQVVAIERIYTDHGIQLKASCAPSMQSWTRRLHTACFRVSLLWNSTGLLTSGKTLASRICPLEFALSQGINVKQVMYKGRTV